MRIFTFLFLTMLLSTVSLNAQETFFTEDFDGSIPAEWTSVEVVGNGQPSSVWVHTTEGPQGSFSTDPLNSTTAGNGWIIFDSDLNCNDPEGQNAWLISPAIDASDKDEVWLTFETYYRSFNDEPKVRVGTDLNDLDSWESLVVFPEITSNEFGGIIAGNEAINPQTINLNLSAFAAGEATFYFAFQFESSSNTANGGSLTGCAYNWQVDDVALLDFSPIPAHDLSISRPRHAPNFGTPAPMVDTVRMAALINNFGSADQTGITVTARIEDAQGQSVDFVNEVGVLDVDSSSVIAFDEFFLPEPVVGDYILSYEVEADSTDALPGNNEVITGFRITEDLFQKDNGNADFFTRPGTIEETWEVGNYYFVPVEGYEVYEVEFSVASNGNAHQGQSVNILLYEINEDDNPDVFGNEDVEVVGFGGYTFTDEENGDLVVAELLDFASNATGVTLKEGAEYLLMIEYTEDMFGVFSDFPTDYDVATVVKSGADWFLGGFTGDGVVIARMRIRTTTNTRNEELLNANLSLFPNPASKNLTMELELEEAAATVEARIMDVNGQVVAVRRLDSVRSQTVNIDVQAYPAGTYFLQVVTEQGVKASRFTVIR